MKSKFCSVWCTLFSYPTSTSSESSCKWIFFLGFYLQLELLVLLLTLPCYFIISVTLTTLFLAKSTCKITTIFLHLFFSHSIQTRSNIYLHSCWYVFLFIFSSISSTIFSIFTNKQNNNYHSFYLHHLLFFIFILFNFRIIYAISTNLQPLSSPDIIHSFLSTSFLCKCTFILISATWSKIMILFLEVILFELTLEWPVIYLPCLLHWHTCALQHPLPLIVPTPYHFLRGSSL